MDKLKLEEDRIYESLSAATPGSKAYTELQSQLGNVYRLMLELEHPPVEKQPSKFERFITNPTVISSGAYLLGMMLMINHENLHIITTKALHQLPKIK